MPLEFPDWTWTQSESTVCIQLPLRGAAGTADIVSTERYLKVETRAQVLSRDRKTTLVCAQVHQPPYLFEAFLFQPVDEAAGTARLADTRVVISLPKKTLGLWTRLRADAGELPGLCFDAAGLAPGFDLSHVVLCFRSRGKAEAEGGSSAEPPGGAVLGRQAQGGEQGGGQPIRPEGHDGGRAGRRLRPPAAGTLSLLSSDGSWRRKNESESGK